MGRDHTEHICSTQQAVDILSELPFFYDEPLGDSSIIPTTLVSQLARKSVTVALSADAGDEVFAGYTRYEYIAKQQNYLKYIPDSLAKLTAKGLSYISPKNIPILNKAYNINSRHEKVINLLNNKHPKDAYKLFLSYFLEKDVRNLIKKPIEFQPTAMDQMPPDGHNGDVIQMMLAFDYKFHMVDCIVAKVDRATMSASLEGREPLLDHRIVEFAAQLPSSMKYHEGIKKVLLKEIVHQHIPKEIMVKRKMGFGAPVHSWFKDDIAKDMLKTYLDPQKIEKQGLLNPKVVADLINPYLQGKSVDFNRIWLLLVFQMWYERWMQ